MFLDPQTAIPPIRRYRAVGLSVAAHLGLLAAIVIHRSTALQLEAASLAYGAGASSYKLVYFPLNAPEKSPVETAQLTFSPSAKKNRKVRADTEERIIAPEESASTADAGNRNSLAGSPLGVMVDGPISGHDVHVAYPVVYPDPPVERSALPPDLIGDVVIEVTIDSLGSVVETKIVQSIGHGIDEKIEATLRRWRYQPATLDGTPVASRHDVHFHFPS